VAAEERHISDRHHHIVHRRAAPPEDTMARVEPLAAGSLSHEQRRIHDEIAATRGGAVRGPFAIWLRNPALADAASRLGNVLRTDGKLDKRLFELAVLVVARHWTAQYEWYVHAKHGLAAGLSEEAIGAIRDRRRPAFAREDEKLVYDVMTELVETKAVSATSYDRVVAAFGLDLTIELFSVAGFYTMVAMVLNAFDAPVPEGEPPLT
jgi:4-carboxymuconolactone decarboxylase